MKVSACIFPLATSIHLGVDVFEHMCYNTKDGELCQRSLFSLKILMDMGSDTDVQIVRFILVYGAKD